MRAVKWTIGLIVAVLVIAAIYMWSVLSWSYSSGERAGYVQQFSKRGWVCKTWEGELALISLPGQYAEKFKFTVHDEEVAKKINAVMGKRVTLNYQQHVGVPTTCFGETEFYVTGVHVVEDAVQPPMVEPVPAPVAPITPPASATSEPAVAN